MDQNQPISPCNGDAISASVGIMARSLQHRRVAWMQDFGDSPTRRSSHSTNPEVERRQPRRDTAHPNFTAFKPSPNLTSRRSCSGVSPPGRFAPRIFPIHQPSFASRSPSILVSWRDFGVETFYRRSHIDLPLHRNGRWTSSTR